METSVSTTNTLIEKKLRNSSIELLRLLAACAVIVLHYNGMGGAVAASSGLSHEVLSLLECLCVCAVDLFIMISGYFLCTTLKRTWDKPIYLLLLLAAIRLTVYISGSLMGGGINIGELIQTVVPPRCYFILLYIALYIISPYLNIVLNRLSSKGRNVLIVVMLLLFSVYPTLIDSYQILVHRQPMGISTVGAWGQQHGYTIVGFILFYAIGAWLRLNNVGKSIPGWKILLLIMGSLGCIYGWFKAEEIRFVSDSSLIEYNALSYTNPFVLLLTALLIVLFSQISFKSKLINTLAKSTFVCYIFHLSLIPHLRIVEFASMGGVRLFVHLIVSVVVIYLASWVVWYILDLILRPVNKWLSRYDIINMDSHLTN